MAYPLYARIRGEKVKLNTSYKVALRCFDVINDDDISDYERTLAIVYLMYGFIPDDELVPEYLEKAKQFLQCGESTEQQNEKDADMDFNYDKKFINASFMSDYRIDLENTPDMHFWQFCELIQGLTDKSILSRVRYIRTVDIKEYAEKDRADIRKAKQQLALPTKLTKEQQEADDFFEAQMRGEV